MCSSDINRKTLSICALEIPNLAFQFNDHCDGHLTLKVGESVYFSPWRGIHKTVSHFVFLLGLADSNKPTFHYNALHNFIKLTL